MSELAQRLRPTESPLRAWQGFVAKTVTDLNQRLEVVIPDFDPHVRWKNCRWQSRDFSSMPARGDDCLVILDSRGEAWVVAWWPFGT